MKHITILVAVLIIMTVAACGGSSSSGDGGLLPGAITAPDATAIKDALGAANPTGMIPGFALAAITMPACTSEIASTGITYAMTGLPAWLTFDDTTRELMLAGGATVVPAEAVALAELTYACTLPPDVTAQVKAEEDYATASVTFVANDVDGGGATDGAEYAFGEVPLVNNSLGWFWLNPGNVALYRTSTRKLPTGITVPQVGMDPTDAADEALDYDGDTLTNGDEINNGTNLFVAASAGTFGAAVPYATTNSEEVDGIAAADLNGDGYTDIVTAQSATSEISVFMNKGDGTFEGAVGYGGPTSNFAVLAADVDGDNDNDVIIVGVGCPGLVWIKINDGTGTLGVGDKKDVAAGAQGMSAADFNEDGIVDIIVSHQGNHLSLLLGNGDGTFADETPIPITPTESQYGLTAADFNGDGHLDIAASGQLSYLLYIGAGDGSFGPITKHSLTGDSDGIASADIDGDGDIDLVVSDDDADTLHVLLNDGSATFTEASTPGVRQDPHQIAPADFNGDGIIDLAVACAGDTVTPTPGSDGIGILIGNGDGTFDAAVYYALDASFTRGPQTVLAADLNNDGDLDIATGSDFSGGSMYILHNE